jgi:hypothetical protein
MALLPSVASSMKGAMVPIASQTLASNSDVSFANIPTSYQDLMIVINGKTAITYAPYAGVYAGINNTYGSGGYSSLELLGNGSAASSSYAASTSYFQNLGQLPSAQSGVSSNLFGSFTMHILNYANTSSYKTILYRCAYDMNGSGGTILGVGTYRSNAAVVQMYLTAAGSFVTGSTITLYGIRKVGQ